ncbi:MAG: undecaprenyl-diphosphate phosphatase [Bacteroidota bacterium]
MEALKALILGIIQGLTEFLPVSSSGHIELGKALLNFDPGEDILFTIIVHFATLLSTVIVFRKDIIEIFKGLFQFKWNEETSFSAKIIISMIPIAIVGVFFEDQVSALFEGKIALVGGMLLVTALLLYLTQYAKSVRGEKGEPVGFLNAFLIGIAQSIAVLPGISRSGSTIATGLLLGVDKERIAKFSFLMVLPPILGATILKTKEFIESPNPTVELLPLTAGFIGAFIAGWIACVWMINIVKKGKLGYFALYCLIVGIIALILGLAV